MRLPLLIGVSPRTINHGQIAVTRLKAGLWRMLSEGLVDSELTLCLANSEKSIDIPFRDGDEIDVTKGCSCLPLINKLGNEKAITIFLELLP